MDLTAQARPAAHTNGSLPVRDSPAFVVAI
jgi:hypothetical protein